MNTAESYRLYLSFFKVYVLPHLPKDKKIKILDIGCGAGHLLYALREEGYTNCLGIDSSKEQIDKAKKQLECVELFDAFQYLPHHKNEFNVITLFDVAEHFSKNKLLTLLKKINNSLQPSGILIIHTLNAWSPFSHFYFFGDLSHQQLYSPKVLGDMAILANFREYYYLPSAPEYLRKSENITSPRLLFHFFLRLIQWILWHLVSRLYGVIVYIAIGKHPKVYTPNFIIVCKK